MLLINKNKTAFKRATLLFGFAINWITLAALAGTPVPHVFVNETVANPTEVNANFAALAARLDALEPKPAAVAIIGTYDFVDINSQINGNLHLSHTAGSGTLTFASGGVVTGSSTWAGSSANIITIDVPDSAATHVSLDVSPNNGTEPLSGSYNTTGSALSIDFGGAGIQGVVSADGKIIILNLHGADMSDEGILIGIKR